MTGKNYLEYQDLRINELRLKNEIEKLKLDNKELKEKFSLYGVSHRRELLPEFLMHDLDGKIITSVIGSADVTKEWNEYLGNCG
jgi:hypothetical protein